MVVERACIVFKISRQGNPERGDEGESLVKANSSHRSVSEGHIRATPWVNKDPKVRKAQ
jgi:hypothetical protein